MKNCLNCKWYTCGEIYSTNKHRYYCACNYASELKYPKLHIFCKQHDNENFAFIGRRNSKLLNKIFTQ